MSEPKSKKFEDKLVKGKIVYVPPGVTQEITIPKCNKIINCDNMIGFHNEHGSCWSIVVLTFMLHSHITGCDFQSKITKQEYDYSSDRLKHYFPSNKVFDCMFKREYIPIILDAIRERIINKHTEQLRSLELPPVAEPLVRSPSGICESKMLQAYFNFFGYDGFKVFDDGAGIQTSFMFMNLLSKTVLNRFINMDIYGEYDIIFSDNAIGYHISIPRHAIGIFKCDNENYYIVDNDDLTPFRFNEFVAKYNECKAIEDAVKLQEKMDKQRGIITEIRPPCFDLMYNTKSGVVIKMANKEMHSFTNHGIDGSESLKHIHTIKKYSLYTGIDSKYKHSSNIITYFYSVEARIIETIRYNNNVDVETLKDQITQIDRRYHNSDTLLMEGIDNRLFENNFDLFRYLVENRNPNLNLVDRFNQTMLHIALYKNCPKIARYLIERGAKIDMKDNQGETQTDILVRYHKNNLNSSFELIYKDHIEHMFTIEGRTIDFIRKKEIAKIKEIEQRIEDINRQHNKSDTLLMEGIRNHLFEEHFNELKDLVETHEPNLNITNMLNETMLHIALKKDCPKIARYLIERGAKIDMKDNQGETQTDILVRYHKNNPNSSFESIYKDHIFPQGTLVSEAKPIVNTPPVKLPLRLNVPTNMRGNKKQYSVRDGIHDDISRDNSSKTSVESIKAEQEYYFDNFEKKYLKYKLKYHQLKKQLNL